ncbi:DUF2501 domain-containing protein [Erwinia sp. B116]|uniref:DUF2501 domain-containing protein n=1 Tax=Erwinia sp. B116 TaxID=1561024 RepID=UPI000C771EAE|nr:DUF2501 domain-containing protein [Erwinia sp. B116]PLV61603.1 endopeptidase [Erwinia sp. B116]
MKAAGKLLIAAMAASALFSGVANAASWQDQLSSAASALGQNNGGSATTAENGATSAQSGTSLTALAGLLNGGSQSLSAGTMSNAAGILSYCVKNNLVDNNVDALKNQVLGKLGLEDTQKQQETTDYQQGLLGLLNTGSNQQVNLKSLGETPLGKQVKTKACDLVLKQGMHFIS